MPIRFANRWRPIFGFLAGATVLALTQPAASSQFPVEAGTLNVRHQIPVGTLPIGISVPDDRFAYAANMGDHTISVIDLRRGVVVRTILLATTRMASCFYPVERRSTTGRRCTIGREPALAFVEGRCVQSRPFEPACAKRLA